MPVPTRPDDAFPPRVYLIFGSPKEGYEVRTVTFRGGHPSKQSPRGRAATLLAARGLLPADVYKLPCSVRDTPGLVEVWL